MRLTRAVIDLSDFLSPKPDETCGASAYFVGRVRNHHGGRRVLWLDYECYEALAEKELARIECEVREKFDCAALRILHRVDRIEVGEVAVVIDAASAHRDEAFKACRETIERIKRTVPIWKREFYQDGTSDWVLCDSFGRMNP